MTLTAVIILVISSFTHAGWNLIGKKHNPTAASFLGANVFALLLLAPLLLVYTSQLAQIPPRVYLFLALSGFFQALYYSSLAAAYSSGDMSVAYPLARSSPVIVVTLMGVFLGKADQIGILCVMGIFLVVLGGFLLPMQKFGDLALKNYLNFTCLTALVAAFATSGYSLSDDEGLRILRAVPNMAINHQMRAVVYIILEGICTVFWLCIYVFFRQAGRRSMTAVIRNPGPTALKGIGIYFTYTLVLISMAFVANVSYVVAFRQLSIPLGVIMSVCILKEPAFKPKILGTVVIFTGLILVGVG